MQNIRLALRTLAKTPLITAVAALSLALGIGANAAIFSLYDQLVLRPLPVPDPDGLVNLSSPGPKPGMQSCGTAGDCEHVFSYPMFLDLEKVEGPFAGLAAHVAFGANLSYRGETESATGMLVSGGYFATLGLKPALGRLFGREDNATAGGHPIVILSHDYWLRRFAGSPEALNQTLLVNGQTLTIAGVAPAGFRGTTLGVTPQIFAPMVMRESLLPGFRGLTDRRSYWAYLFARLAPGTSMAEAEKAVNVTYRALINEVEAPLQTGMSEQTMTRFRARTVVLAAGARGQSSVRSESSAPLILLLGATGFVLAIACANVANLLLARSASRAGEIAVRLSVGASRRQLVVQLLTEACLLALLAGLGSLVVASWTISFLASQLPAESAGLIHVGLDLKVLGFTAVIALGTGLLFGLFPALHSTRPDLALNLKGSANRAAGSRAAARFRASLVTVQIALAMALLVSAGLFTKSLANVSRVDLGLKADHLITFGISPELNGTKPEASRALFARLEEELGALPGVSGVGASMIQLIAGNNWGNGMSAEGFDTGPDVDAHSMFNEVGPGFFNTLGIPLLAGRDFTTADTLGAPKVAVVNQTFAKKFNLGPNPVGKRIGVGRGNAVELDMEIIGLVADAKYSEVKQQVPPLYFAPYRQDDGVGSMNFYVRTSLAPEQLMSEIRGTVRRLEPNLPLENLRTLEMQIRDNVFLDRFISTLSIAFATLATLLAAIGLYGVLAYSVAQRTREIGLRMALGADRHGVRTLVLRQVGLLTAIGGGVGVAAALGLARVGRALLFELQGHDPFVLTAAAVALGFVALAAGLIPAARASRVEPMLALRYE